MVQLLIHVHQGLIQGFVRGVANSMGLEHVQVYSKAKFSNNNLCYQTTLAYKAALYVGVILFSF